MRVAAVVTLFVLASCGARTPLIVDESCHGPTIPVSSDLPTLYYVLDHSRSMREGDKWTQVRSALATVMTKIGPRARFATVMYPEVSAGLCAAGTEVMPPTRGSLETVQQFLTKTSADPDGGTPTSDTIEMLAKKLVGAKNTYAVLATDGGPNCNSQISCDVSQCVLNIEGLGGCSLNGPSCCTMSAQNCLDGMRAIDAVKHLKASGVPTYVVGIPGSELYFPILDTMAVEGGTARPMSPKYYRVETSESLATALDDIATRVIKGCSLHLERAPLHASTMRVQVRGTDRTEFTVNGTTLVLEGSACTDYDGDIAQLHVEDGCVIASP